VFPEISLHILDLVQNSICAEAGFIEISVETAENRLTVVIRDNGRGMTAEMLKRVTDPFTTSRTSRRVGLGIPFAKLASELTGGSFSIQSESGIGTAVKAVFRTDSIDCMPLGDLPETLWMLVTLNLQIDFLITRTVNGRTQTFDTRAFRAELAPVPPDDPTVKEYLREYFREMEKMPSANDEN